MPSVKIFESNSFSIKSDSLYFDKLKKMEEAYLAYSTLPPFLYIIGGFCAALLLTAITLPPNAESRMQEYFQLQYSQFQ